MREANAMATGRQAPLRYYLFGVALCLLSTVCFIGMALLLKKFSSAGVSGLGSVWVRCLVTLVIVHVVWLLSRAPYCPKRRQKVRLRLGGGTGETGDGREDREERRPQPVFRYLILQALFNLLAFAAFGEALNHVSVGVTAAIFFTAPIYGKEGGEGRRQRKRSVGRRGKRGEKTGQCGDGERGGGEETEETAMDNEWASAFDRSWVACSFFRWQSRKGQILAL
uniref:Uncharacterized protein n=1 Tax=Chromera velia CCMP2878 TaxID=1169474 RepID=A0A0G4IDT5_9ALVE|eukprot:Cvel_13516.t1-p1 / transcript=Cvel_13516.t1 / gene=Cvel_13516 / organism=Chromera_velia_CCMP2878 / gene_product=hypothetical protein / transcript_product=hypothetical protein / location=Cvel_scaffold927:7827-8580(-) / protein_length=223 / sequence_SO=supercontig / SO=protein_coding / is_pseudo=false